jgi:hypothetical protein
MRGEERKGGKERRRGEEGRNNGDSGSSSSSMRSNHQMELEPSTYAQAAGRIRTVGVAEVHRTEPAHQEVPMRGPLRSTASVEREKKNAKSDAEMLKYFENVWNETVITPKHGPSPKVRSWQLWAPLNDVVEIFCDMVRGIPTPNLTKIKALWPQVIAVCKGAEYKQQAVVLVLTTESDMRDVRARAAELAFRGDIAYTLQYAAGSKKNGGIEEAFRPDEVRWFGTLAHTNAEATQLILGAIREAVQPLRPGATAKAVCEPPRVFLQDPVERRAGESTQPVTGRKRRVYGAFVAFFGVAIAHAVVNACEGRRLGKHGLPAKIMGHSGALAWCDWCKSRGHTKTECEMICMRLDGWHDTLWNVVWRDRIRTDTRATFAWSGNTPAMKRDRPWMTLGFTDKSTLRQALPAINNLFHGGHLSRSPLVSYNGIPPSCSDCGLLNDVKQRQIKEREMVSHTAGSNHCPRSRRSLRGVNSIPRVFGQAENRNNNYNNNNNNDNDTVL